ncbi:MAG: response regulator [Bacteroidetes bacterium]|nr:response regulator [Bacteroidota bacterium]
MYLADVTKIIKMPIKYCCNSHLFWLCLAVVWFLLPAHVHGQNYNFNIYDSEKGLSSNLTKRVVKDKDGLIWVATDGGVVYFDGIQFRTITSGLPSQYIKDIVITPTGDMLVISDMGIGKITAGTGYHRLIPGTEIDSDTSIVYPKTVYSDRFGRMWISEATGVSRLDGQKLKKYRFPLRYQTDSYNRSFLFAEDQFGRLLMTSWKGMVFLFDPQSDSFIELPLLSGQSGLQVNVLKVMSDSSIWIGTNRGIYRFVPQANITGARAEKVSDLPMVSSLAETEDRSVLIGSFTDGLFILYPGKGNKPRPIANFPFEVVNSITIDDEGIVWAATDDGVVMATETLFNTVGIQNQVLYVRGVKTSADGSVLASDQERIVQVLFSDSKVKQTVVLEKRESFLYDFAFNERYLWISTRDGQLTRLNRKTMNRQPVPLPVSAFRLNHLTMDPENRLWAFSEGDGKVVCVDSTLVPRFYQSASGADFRFGSLVVTPDGSVFGIAGKGISTIHKYDQESDRFSQWTFTVAAGSPTPELIRTLYPGSVSGEWWLGAANGLFRYYNGIVSQITTVNQFGVPSVKSLVIDNYGQLWIGTETGIIVYHNLMAAFFGKQDGLSNTTITHHAMTVDPEGRIWTGTAKGLGYWQKRVQPVRITPLPKFSTISFNDQPVELGRSDSVSVLEESSFTAGFYAVTYPAEYIQFQCRLVGHQENWTTPSSQKIIYYPSLPSGNFIFQVRAIKSGHFWSEPAEYRFVITPHWYSTWYIQIIGFLVIGFGFFMVSLVMQKRRFQRMRERQQELQHLVNERTLTLVAEKERTEKALEDTEKARNEAESQRIIAEQAMETIKNHEQKLIEADRIKSRFFANISHEFRTPLTLTIGPLENAIEGSFGKVTPKLKNQLTIALRNSRRLLRLINQLLEISKVDAGQSQLRVSRQDIVTVNREITQLFGQLCAERRIQYITDSNTGSAFCWFDVDKVEKIIFNLVTNAIKFTPDGGSIRIETEVNSDLTAFEFRITDSGRGFKEEELPFIFDRFFHGDHLDSSLQEGTGIGLSLARDLVALHKGIITVESQPGKGSTFYFRIPISRDTWSDEEIAQDSADPIHGFIERAKSELAEFSTGINLDDINFDRDESGEKPVVLVVDDNKDIRTYIRAILEDKYDIIEAENGKEALEAAEEQIPTLILTDIMMPVMDGYEFCRRVRSNDLLSHVPIILLTAKASGEMKAEGLEIGADDYMYKPFYTKELLARVKNLIQLRQQESQLKRMNRELESMVDAMKKADSLKSKLLSIAAHDLRNPLNSIIGYVELIESQLPTDSDIAPRLQKIHKSAARMVGSIRELLDSSYIDLASLSLNLKPVDMNAVLNTVVIQNEPLSHRKNQRIQFDNHLPEKFTIKGDEDKIRNIFDNLVSNAVKYSPAGKTISVRAYEKPEGIRVEVEDEGPGFTQEDQQRLYQRYQRLSAQPTGGELSTGLGLSIVKEFTDLHHGTLSLESIPGAGSTFIVELPRG